MYEIGGEGAFAAVFQAPPQSRTSGSAGCTAREGGQSHVLCLPNAGFCRGRSNGMRAQRATDCARLQQASLRGDFYDRGVRVRLWRGNAFGAHTLEVKLDGLAHGLLDRLTRRASRHATWHIRRIRRKTGRGLFYDNEQSHDFNPACLRMLFNVPGASSSLG